MNKYITSRITDKWLLVLSHYEKVKTKSSNSFKTVNELCEAYKVHRKDIRKYYERWIKSGKYSESLLPRRRGPKKGQLKILSKDEERTILNIHRKLGANEFEIYEMIKDHRSVHGERGFRIHPSVSTIYRTLRRYPLNKKRKEKIKRYEKRYPGELMHSDTSVLAKTLFADRKRYYLFGLIDDCTRLCYVELIEEIKAARVTKAFFNGYRWFWQHGIRIEEVMTDNGIEFTSFTSQKAKDTHFFETMLSIFGIKHRYTRPYRPQTNGKIERFWEIIKEECIRIERESKTRKEIEASINGYMYMYNYQRRHGGIKYQTPLEKLKFVTEIVK
jgi:transposase InsO family protein